jgi:hypothetical protein
MSVGFIPTLSAQFQGKRGLIFACERLVGVLAVFELDHRLALLEPFQTPHKGKFARSAAFDRMGAATLTFASNAAVQHVRCSFIERDYFAHAAQSRCSDATYVLLSRGR